MDKLIGIDLETTNSEVAVIENGRPVIIPVEGDKLLPSVVGNDPSSGEILVGKPARNQYLVHPRHTVRSIKRRMGQREKVYIGSKEHSPEEISAMILGRLKAAAEAYPKKEVKRAVITVPAYFNDLRRRATMKAGEIAGLEVVRIINEPTPEAMTYGHTQEEDGINLVYDLGGGTFDVSVVERAGDYGSALALFEKVITLEGGHAETYRIMGKVHLFWGELESAQRCWRRSLVLEPEDTGSAACLRVLERFWLIRRAMATVAVLAVPLVVAGALWYQWSILGRMHETISDLDASIRTTQRAEPTSTTRPLLALPSSLTTKPQESSIPGISFEIRYRDALSEAMNGNLKTVRSLFEALVKEIPAKEPLGGNAHFWLGRCLFELGGTRRALDQFHTVVERFPNREILNVVLAAP